MKKRIAILATHGFEESELKSPKEQLEQQGWEALIVSPEAGSGHLSWSAAADQCRCGRWPPDDLCARHPCGPC